MTMNTQRAEEILAYWFGGGGNRNDLWFGGTKAIDAEIRERFGEDLAKAAVGELDGWAATPRGRLALIIVLDQFSRNVFRGRPGAFKNDRKAQALTKEGIEAGMDRALAPLERAFFYMPLQHAEDRALQDLSVERFTALAAEAPPELRAPLEGFRDDAERHRKVIEEFGRFPQRNHILGRTATYEEWEYLKKAEPF